MASYLLAARLSVGTEPGEGIWSLLKQAMVNFARRRPGQADPIVKRSLRRFGTGRA